MKKLVGLLVVINIGLLVYFNSDRILPGSPAIKQLEINPEKITILSQQQIDALPKKSSSVPNAKPAAAVAAMATTTVPTTTVTTATSCYEWGIFSAPNVAGAQTAVSKLSLQATVNEQTTQDAKRFWVYRPPFKSTQEAQVKVAELKALGVQDMFVVQEPKWRNAISFGVFEDEQLATKLMNELKAKGVRDVVKALRNQGKGHFSLLFKNLAEPQVTALKQLKPAFPEAELKEIPCI
jgi:hypothetical protein